MLSLNLEQAEELAARTLAAIDVMDAYRLVSMAPHFRADRARVASDLAGLRRALYALHQVDLSTTPSPSHPEPWLAQSKSTVLWLRTDFAAFAQEASDGLVRTAALYGVTL